jgi:transaldolase/glucose-6-phosphate isomerase
MPLATIEAFRDHGKLRDTLQADVAEAQRLLGELDRAGVSLQAVTDKLIRDGVRLFADAADKLLGAVAHKRIEILGDKVDRQGFALDAQLKKRVDEITDEWRAHGNVRRLWRRDKSLWTNNDEDRWLGWLDSIDDTKVAEYVAFASEIRQENFKDAVLLGMGGSSLGPQVLAETFGQQNGWPRLRILDSTVPAQIKELEAELDLSRTIFIVSSKSGGTTEPNILKDYFFAKVADKVGANQAGKQFIAITDPGSALERNAKEQRFRRVFHGVPSIGGRYSVLSPFGLVPAAIAGLNVAHLVELSRTMIRSCGPDVPPAENPAIALGVTLGAAASRGRDKVTMLAAPALASFGAWVEQLFAESTGKQGKGLIPIDGETLGRPEVYGDDRLFIDLALNSKNDTEHEAKLKKLETAGHPVVRIAQNSLAHIVQEFVRFEIATAVAGAVLGINPFDQPDVESSKSKTRDLTSAFEKSGELPRETPVYSDQSLAVFTNDVNAAALRKAGAGDDVTSWLAAHFAQIGNGDYFALLAYLARNGANTSALGDLRLALRDRRHVATCLEFGPRFLHSTGQAYKGGPDSGVFLQITADDGEDLAIPGHRASFGVVKNAQARGDFDVLLERGRRALRVHIKGDIAAGLKALHAAFERALVSRFRST